MNRNIKITICALLFSLSSIAKADLYEMKNDYSEDVLAKGTKKIQYDLKVYKDNNIVYASSISLENSTVTPIFYISDNGIKAEELESSEVGSLNLSGKKESKENLNHEIQLRVAVHISKNKIDMWSQFFLQQVDANVKNSIAAVVNQDKKEEKKEDKKLKMDIAPEANKLDKEIIVAHQRNKKAMIEWKGYRFELNAH